MVTLTDGQLLIKQVIQAVVADLSMSDTRELKEYITHEADEEETQAEEFCDRFDLGNWFYDAMIDNEINIVDELDGIFMRKYNDSLELQEEERMIQSSREAAES